MSVKYKAYARQKRYDAVCRCNIATKRFIKKAKSINASALAMGMHDGMRDEHDECTSSEEPREISPKQPLLPESRCFVMKQSRSGGKARVAKILELCDKDALVCVSHDKRIDVKCEDVALITCNGERMWTPIEYLTPIKAEAVKLIPGNVCELTVSRHVPPTILGKLHLCARIKLNSRKCVERKVECTFIRWVSDDVAQFKYNKNGIEFLLKNFVTTTSLVTNLSLSDMISDSKAMLERPSSVVGRSISVYKDKMCWIDGVVDAYDEVTGKHSIRFSHASVPCDELCDELCDDVMLIDETFVIMTSPEVDLDVDSVIESVDIATLPTLTWYPTTMPSTRSYIECRYCKVWYTYTGAFNEFVPKCRAKGYEMLCEPDPYGGIESNDWKFES